MVRERERVLAAVNQALNAIEIDEDVNFYDMLRTAKQMYMRSRGSGQNKRAEGTPGRAADMVFKWDPEVQRLMASRDCRLTEYRDDLAKMATHDAASNARDAELQLVHRFIENVRKKEGARAERRYPWIVNMHGVDVTFQGQDVYALWVCLKQLLT